MKDYKDGKNLDTDDYRYITLHQPCLEDLWAEIIRINVREAMWNLELDVLLREDREYSKYFGWEFGEFFIDNN